MKTLIDGFLQFRTQVFPKERHVFRELAKGQNPETLFITCADSRVVPTLITQSGPGDLFICRTIGNQVPPYGSTAETAVSSAIEYALQVLQVKSIVVCGHSDCGAMKAVLHPSHLADLPSTAAWLKHASAARSVVVDSYKDAPDSVLLHLLAEENVIAQLNNLRTHPSVAARLARGELELYGWVYHIHSGDITSYDAKHGCFSPLDLGNANATPAPRLRPMVVGGAA